MPPMVLRIHVLNSYGREIRLWIPLFLLSLLMLPFAIIVLPVLLIVACSMSTLSAPWAD